MFRMGPIHLICQKTERAVRKHAAALSVDRGEVFFTRRTKKVRAISTTEIAKGLPFRTYIGSFWDNENV